MLSSYIALRDLGREGAGGAIQIEELVINDYLKPGDNAARNHHKSYGYLRTPELSARIKDFLRP